MLEIKNISAGYGDKTVLENTSVSFERGKLISIIGPNGCGKSTLLLASLDILPISGGEITLDGQDLGTLGRNEIAKRIAYLAQGKSTPDMTVMQMVLHGRFPYLSYPRRYTEKDRAVAYSAMERVGICELADTPLSSLSGGMRQNAYIAMALAQDTDYILLDEPTTYLDISHQISVMRILRELAEEGKGIVAVMHDLPLAFELSDEIAVLHGKNIVCKDSPKIIADTFDMESVFGVRIKYLEEENKYIYTV